MNEPKSHFKNWCFLCSREDETVDIEISGLHETMRETIGQFSFLNFTLPNMPSKICLNCNSFLIEIERRKQHYAKVEQMYLELIRMPSRSTTADYAEIKTRHNIEELINISDMLSEEKMVEVQVEYVTESSFPDTSNFNFEIVNVPEKIPSSSSSAPNKTEEIVKKRTPILKTKRTSANSKSPKLKILPTADSFHCDLCAKTFKTKLQIMKHITSFHILGKNLSVKTNSGVLNASTSKNIGKTFECNLCSKSFKTKAALVEHEKTHFDVKNHSCPHCPKKYKTASTLAQHLDTHDKTTYECNECGAKLNTRRTLRQHQLKHSEVAKHTCEFCQAQFKRTKTYKEHLICIHTDIKAYQCDWCDRKFSNGANCRKHKKEIHPEALKKAEAKMEKSIVTLPSIPELIEISRKRLNNNAEDQL